MLMRFLLLLSVVAILGCDPSGGPRSTVSVQGKVTLDGTPVDTGTILFEPKDGKGASASGTISAGNYETRVEPGIKIVRITYPKVVRQEQVYPGSATSPVVDVTEEQIPAKYNTQSRLEKDLTEANDGADFDLTTK